MAYLVGPVLAVVRLILIAVVGVRAKQEKQRSGSKSGIQAGDLIISNHSSYIDVIMLEMLYSPNYLFVHPSGKVQIITFRQAITQSTSYPPTDTTPPPIPSTPLTTLKEALKTSKAHGKPLSLFPEGTTSNNRGLLKLTPALDLDPNHDPDTRIHVVGFRYLAQGIWGGDERVSPTFTVSTWVHGGKGNRASVFGIMGHTFALASEVSHGLEVRILDGDEALEAFAVRDAGRSTLGGLEASSTLSGRAGLLLGQVTRLRMTGLALEDKRGFWDYYVERETGSKRSGGGLAARHEIRDLQAGFKKAK
ncbi:hypothetical protein HDU67_007163 [Dinochytrium kinnereticum]|nr:hypothetical protein HDU67_007163 [Dinochytrium kinnereticum]